MFCPLFIQGLSSIWDVRYWEVSLLYFLFHTCVQKLYKGFAQRLKTNLILYLDQVIMLPIKQYPRKNGRCVTLLQQMEMIDYR